MARQSTQSCSNCCSIDGPTERLLSVFFEPSSHRSVSHTSSLLVQVSLCWRENDGGDGTSYLY